MERVIIEVEYDPESHSGEAVRDWQKKVLGAFPGEPSRFGVEYERAAEREYAFGVQIGGVDRQEIVGAVARGWTHPDTEHLVMDEKLAYAIVEEIEAAAQADRTPRLGCATTVELLAELQARAVIGGYADYRTVDS